MPQSEGESVDDRELIELYNRTQDAAHTLRPQAAELLEMTKQLERLTKDTPARYAGTRARVEARAALEQAEELRRVLEKLEVLADGKTELPALLAHLRKQDPLLVSAEHHHRKAVSS
jgi:hypothetical protein